MIERNLKCILILHLPDGFSLVDATSYFLCMYLLTVYQFEDPSLSLRNSVDMGPRSILRLIFGSSS